MYIPCREVYHTAKTVKVSLFLRTLLQIGKVWFKTPIFKLRIVAFPSRSWRCRISSQQKFEDSLGTHWIAENHLQLANKLPYIYTDSLYQ